MQRCGFLAIPFFLLPLVTACSSLGTKLDANRAKAVKRVAVLSVMILQQQPKDAFGFSKAGEMKTGRMTDGPEFQKMAKGIATDFSGELKSKTGWQVVSLETMIGNPEYSAKVKEKMSGLHSMTLTGSNTMEEVDIAGVLNNATFRSLKQAEKVKLARAVGADAFAELTIIQSIDQGYSLGNLTGKGAFAFTSRANLMVFDLNSEEPIWRVQNVDGELSQNSSNLPEDMPKVQKLAQIGLESAKSAIHKLVEKYKTE